jgi:alkaline phosphatase D
LSWRILVVPSPITTPTALPSGALDRRAFLKGAIAGATGLLTSCSGEKAPVPSPLASGKAGAPAIVTRDSARPAVTHGVQSGDITASGAIVWSRSDRIARMILEWSDDASMRNARRIVGPIATAESDFTARMDLDGLPSGQRIHYRVSFEDPGQPRAASEAVVGSLMTAPTERRDIVLAWSGDVAGQGFGINPDLGGMRIFESMRRLSPDFFIHSGDQIYADNPILAEVRLEDGSLWRNVTTAAKAKVAETLAEFRGNFAYNLIDANVRRFYAEVPSLVQWDDHEVRNNWYPGRTLDDDNRYTEKSASTLAARARRAMLEYAPLRTSIASLAETTSTASLPAVHEAGRIYRSVKYGPSLEVFLLDARSYRGPNTTNDQPAPGPATKMLGDVQLAWLKGALRASQATWKLIACDVPIGLVVPDRGPSGEPWQEGFANGSGPPRGREIEIAEILRFMRESAIKNTVWVTADVHYAAAHHYHPERARFREFIPFWEFIAGPLNAGTFGPNDLDDTFGPEVRFRGIPEGMKQNRPPSEGLQFFGTVRIDGRSDVMTVALHNLEGATIFKVDLAPAR